MPGQTEKERTIAGHMSERAQDFLASTLASPSAAVVQRGNGDLPGAHQVQSGSSAGSGKGGAGQIRAAKSSWDTASIPNAPSHDKVARSADLILFLEKSFFESSAGRISFTARQNVSRS
jgi:hypothetical protein